LIQDREEAAILLNINTMSPQTAYSTPKLAWRPDGSGIYVTSDDGIIRGFEASTGKLVVSLRGHESGSKIRCLWAGFLDENADDSVHSNECVISGGFDRKLILWKSD
jgi:WD40 repeat protein